MFLSDLSYTLIWWLVIFLLGMITVPFTLRLFHNFADRGYAFSKIIGVLIVSYLTWILGSLKILPFTPESMLFVILILIAISITLVKKQKFTGSTLPLKIFLLEELLFLGALIFWSYVKANEPSIHGLEKFMDFGFVNSLLRSRFFPPLDMWLSRSPDYLGGYHVNYYYFGHLVTAVLTKLSGIDSAITYNLMIATLFAFTFTLSFSLGANLYYFFKTKLQTFNLNFKFPFGPSSGRGQISNFKLIMFGLLTAFLVTFAGNLHSIYSFTRGYSMDSGTPPPPWTLPLGFHPETYWYPNATRFIPFTIHEFPLYSFVVSDLHGHVSDIPFVLLIIAYLLHLLYTSPKTNNPKVRKARGLPETIRKFWQETTGELTAKTSTTFADLFFLGVLAGIMYMTNAWDGLIYLGLSILVIFAKNIIRQRSFFHSLTAAISASIFLFFFFLLANLPFSLNFRPFVFGIGVLCPPSVLTGKTVGPFLFEAGKCQKSPLWMLAILWGFFYFNVWGFLIFIIKRCLKRTNLTGNSTKAGRPQQNSFPGNIFPTDAFVSLLIIVSTALLIFPEFFYVKDIYPLHYRANTMFKLGYQAFIMLSLSSAYIFFRIKTVATKNIIAYIFRTFYMLIFAFLFFFVAIYPYFAISSYFNGLRDYHGLNGLNWLKTTYADDYEAIVWLRNNIKGQPVIAEAVGESYTDYARVSANTGLPTIVGWPVHEWLWRGSYDEPGKRIPEVETLYESANLEETRGIIRKYNVSLVFIGTKEKEKYPQLNEEKFRKLGKVVFAGSNTKIYQVP